MENARYLTSLKTQLTYLTELNKECGSLGLVSHTEWRLQNVKFQRHISPVALDAFPVSQLTSH